MAPPLSLREIISQQLAVVKSLLERLPGITAGQVRSEEIEQIENEVASLVSSLSHSSTHYSSEHRDISAIHSVAGASSGEMNTTRIALEQLAASVRHLSDAVNDKLRAPPRVIADAVGVLTALGERLPQEHRDFVMHQLLNSRNVSLAAVLTTVPSDECLQFVSDWYWSHRSAVRGSMAGPSSILADPL